MNPTSDPSRRPRIALMGEFSAGKSTLANLLLGQDWSPVQVTATQLPPVCYKHGATGVTQISATGRREPLPVDSWAHGWNADARMIEISLDADILSACDLIDMPGTSDPNMVPELWREILPQVDLVIWCTPANQAWRQSEAALWELAPAHLHETSLLLITRMDQVLVARDRARLVARVRREVDGQFRAVLPIALTRSLAAREDEEVLEESGAAALMRVLADALDVLRPPERSDLALASTRLGPLDVASDAAEADVVSAPTSHVQPRRVPRIIGSPLHPRPAAQPR